ncbi:MAG: LacI family DNA-binding transcriptional regulator [Calditrichia bacterium]|jgi:LacI family transcriptional regulator|nr:LacI family DNA-binding transcriptional regulator [Calditrichia bacterium]
MDHSSKTTLKTLSSKLGFSETTISRVLNGKAEKYRISKKTADIIIQSAKDLNFTPNILARGLRLKKTHTLGLVIPDISNPFFASIARSVEREARKFGYSIILCDTEENTNIEIKSVQLLRGRNMEGLVVAPVGQTASHLEDVYNAGLPIVIIDRCFPNKNLPYVTSDNYQGAYEAISYLIDNGHRRIACIQGLENTSPNNDRIRGYKDALLNNHIPYVKSIIVGDSFGELNGYTEAKILLKKKDRPTAIFAFSNLISLGALKAIEEENLSVPEDISIVAFDDQPYFDHLATPMSSVAQQHNEIGQIATKIIFKQIKSKTSSVAEGVLIPTKLIKRASVKRIQQSIYHEKELA